MEIICSHCGEPVKKPRMKQKAAARGGRSVCCSEVCRRAYRARVLRERTHSQDVPDIVATCVCCGDQFSPKNILQRIKASKGGPVVCTKCRDITTAPTQRPICPFESGAIPARSRQGVWV